MKKVDPSSSTTTNAILAYLYDASKNMPRSSDLVFSHIHRLHPFSAKQFYNTVYKLQKRGVLEKSKKDAESILVLTDTGKLEALLAKAIAPHPVGTWGGKWYMVLFDIPESDREQRNVLRTILIKNGFYKLQASVFVHAYPLNTDAVAYLTQTGMAQFVRFATLEHIDHDVDLRKVFGLGKISK